jgi:hypothetical protein
MEDGSQAILANEYSEAGKLHLRSLFVVRDC